MRSNGNLLLVTKRKGNGAISEIGKAADGGCLRSEVASLFFLFLELNQLLATEE